MSKISLGYILAHKDECTKATLAGQIRLLSYPNGLPETVKDVEEEAKASDVKEYTVYELILVPVKKVEDRKVDWEHLHNVSIEAVSYVGYANYAEREGEALEKVDEAFNKASAKIKNKKEKELLDKIAHVVISAIKQVAGANYDEIEREAKKRIYQAFSEVVK